MKSKLLLLAAFLGLGIVAKAQNYPVSAIADSLKVNADFVVRESNTTVSIYSDSKMVTRITFVYTILNERAKSHADIGVMYTPDSPITDFSGAIYDANGKQIKKIKNSDLFDHSYSESFNLYEETRIKEYAPNYPIYPFTIKYSIEITHKGIQGLPSWQPLNSFYQSVEQSSITVNTPETFDIRYKTYNLKDSVKVTSSKGIKTYSYSSKPLKALKHEVQTPDVKDFLPKIEFASNAINVDGIKGSTATWEDFGKYFFDLQKDRNSVSPKLQAQFGELKGKPVVEIAEAIRKYLNENTRYVNIMVGSLSGVQTTKAADVEKYGYGDCKGLSNFAQSLFAQAGVVTFATYINATPYDKFDPSFVKDRFNHVILCVPTEKKDTLWMDCTSPDYNLGFLSVNDANKTVLLLKPEGGELSRTTKFGKADNTQLRTINLSVKEDGGIDGTFVTSVRNLQAQEIFYKYRASVEDQRKETLSELSFSNPTIKSLTYTKKEGSDLNMIENLTLSATGYATIVGKRIFVPIIPMDRKTLLPKYDKRMFDIQRNFAYTNVDTIRLELPQGYVLESRPKDADLKTEFGTYTSSLKVENNVVTIIRKLEMNDGIFPAASYNTLYDFYKKMSESDNSKLVIVKQST